MLPLPLRRGDGDNLRLDPLVVRLNLYCPSIVRLEHFEECRRGHAADRKFLRAIQKISAAESPMHVSVK